MTDDELLLSAFKKLLSGDVFVSFDDGANAEPGFDFEATLLVDGDVGVTVDEVHAVERFCSGDEPLHVRIYRVIGFGDRELVYDGPDPVPGDVLANGETYTTDDGSRFRTDYDEPITSAWAPDPH
jgi:hypothetical protein